MMIKNIFLIVFIALGFIGCIADKIKDDKVNDAQLISDTLTKAESPNFTFDNDGNVVLSWVETNNDTAVLMYSVFDKTKSVFEKSIKIIKTKGLSPHHESVPKIAFKSDGTAVVVFQKKVPTKNNRFAGALYCTQFKQGSNTWSKPAYVHTNVEKGIGRSFFDIVTLPDGEVGAVWLDGKKKQRSGSTLMFAKTIGGIFDTDVEIADLVCQCCRTDIYVDDNKNINIAYRNIFNDSIRDMAYIFSKDNGNTFTKPLRISNDNWVINGCPHTGPTMTSSNKGLQFYWFTMGGGEGVYNAHLPNGNNIFSDRKMMSKKGQHPQAISLNDSMQILVWDEMVAYEKTYNSRIAISIINNENVKTKYITTSNVNANYPVVISLNNKQVLVAYSQMVDDKKEVYCKLVNTAELIDD